MVPGGKDSLLAMYEYATKEPYAFLLIDIMRPSSTAFFKKLQGARRPAGVSLTCIGASCAALHRQLLPRVKGAWHGDGHV